MRRWTRAVSGPIGALAAISLVACGGDGAIDSRECRDGAMASDNSFLPFSVGNTWKYRVTRDVGAQPEEKRQELEEEMIPDGETEPVIVQRTVKPEGATVSWLRKQGDVIVRLRQEDYDPDGVLEQTTVYEPAKIRFDANADHIAEGAVFEDIYKRTVTDPDGILLSETDITDQWTVVDADAECQLAWATVSCLRLRRVRIVGGIANKEFYFARGYGKVLETGGQTEELTDCAFD
ncbi:MAG: hypothetical protein MJE77_34365 [Proteobacteria bacterium]|nr:hypothetical protein [Pseudomonadota bacterium]